MPTPSPLDETSTPSFTFRQRILLTLIAWAGTAAIRLIGATLRYSVSIEEGGPAAADLGRIPGVFSFWHRCVFPATYIFRGLGFRVMTSQSFDGEYIARIIDQFGFAAVRGSSTRGGIRALLGMRREVEQGKAAVFTIDGPRGPRYVAKPGPVLLAKATGAPMVAFYVAPERAWVLKTWDAFLVPKPFSKVLARIGRHMFVPAAANEEDVQRWQEELQKQLERVQAFAEANVGKVGSGEFPVVRSKM